jgi:hygromycin-B 4-O-kinase
MIDANADAAGGDEVRSAELAPAEIARFLRERLGGPISDVVRIPHGEWSRAFGFRYGDGDYVVRFSAVEADFQKDQLASSYASPRLPLPRLLAVGAAFDGFFAISQRAQGKFLDELDAAGMHRLLPALLDVLDGLREADISTTHGFGQWGVDGNAPHATWRAALLDIGHASSSVNRIHGARQRLASRPSAQAAFDAAAARLESLAAACPTDRYLIHSDLLNFNVLVAEERVSGVIDWGSSLYGDFLFDLAWLTFWQPWYPAWAGIDIRAAARRHYASIGLAVPHFEARMRCYETVIGLDNQLYSAFKGKWAQLETVAQRTLAISRSGTTEY